MINQAGQMKGEPLAILLVEDDPGHADLILRCLRRHRVTNRIHHVSDGEAALDYLFQRGPYSDPETSPQPHLVLLDLRLPKIDGLQVLSQIKGSKKLRHLPVVILSTSEDEQDVAKAYNAHANSYLVKPVDYDKFIQLTKDLQFYWLVWNRHPWR